MRSDPSSDGNRILLLAPHSDDIAYSLGATMLSPWWWGRPDLDILTLFVRSRHAPYLQTESEGEITRARMKEDQSYAARLGARLIKSPFGEAMTRGYPNISSIYQVGKPEDDPAFAQVEAFLKPFIGRNSGYRFVLAPLAIGSHIEHDIAFRIVSQSARIRALYYEDQPYAADYSNYYLGRFLDRRLGPKRAGLVCASDELMDAKVDYLLIYASQFQPEDAGSLRRYANRRRPGVLVHSLAAKGYVRPAEVLWGSEADVDAMIEALRADLVGGGELAGVGE